MRQSSGTHNELSPFVNPKMDETGMGNSWVTKHMLHCVTSQTELQTRNFYSDNKFGISNSKFLFRLKFSSTIFQLKFFFVTGLLPISTATYLYWYWTSNAGFVCVNRTTLRFEFLHSSMVCAQTFAFWYTESWNFRIFKCACV